MFDILIEYLQKGDKHDFIGFDDNWLLDDDVHSRFAIDIVVMF